MPVKVQKRGNKYQVVEPSGRVAKGPSGAPVKKGGHSSKAAADAQVRAMYANKNRKRK